MPIPLHLANPLPPGFALPNLESASALPLQGLTVLAVEDSRYACEALRLMCRRAGARLRRADTIANARAHLRVYRPDVVIIDLGLPDGRGEALIRDLVMAPQRPGVILGTSGLPNGRASALASGADEYLDKPILNFAHFCATLCLHSAPFDATAADVPLRPDTLALRDDWALAAEQLAAAPDAAQQLYVTRFLAGIARHSNDHALAFAATQAAENTDPGLQALRQLIAMRLAQSGQIGQ